MMNCKQVKTKMNKLEKQLIQRCQQKDLLIMSHAVLGFPSFDINKVVINELVKANIDMIELQFPFSEPIADGPVLLKANQESVDCGTDLDSCFSFTEKITNLYPQTLFLIMTYYNILFKRGVKNFVRSAASSGVMGIIVPDLPPEEAEDYVDACRKYDLAPIFLFTPQSSNLRLRYISKMASGMIYCVARKGVTGCPTLFSEDFDSYIQRVRAVTSLPIGVGFGIQTKEDINYLKGRVDIAIVCTQAVKICLDKNPQSMGKFMSSLRD